MNLDNINNQMELLQDKNKYGYLFFGLSYSYPSEIENAIENDK